MIMGRTRRLATAISCSLAIHFCIILILLGVNKGEKVDSVNNAIKIQLVVKQKKDLLKSPALSQVSQASTKPKIPIIQRRLEPLTNKKTTLQKIETEMAKADELLKSGPGIDLGLQQLRVSPAVPPNNTSHSSSLSQGSGQEPSKGGALVMPQEMPRCRQCREPRIPRLAEKRGDEGYATYRLYINPSGNVVKAQLLDSSGHEGWSKAAQRAAITSTFEPMAKKNTIDIMYEMRTNKR